MLTGEVFSVAGMGVSSGMEVEDASGTDAGGAVEAEGT